MTTDPRSLALEILLFWHRSPHTLDVSLETHGDTVSRLEKNDRSLCNALVFGVLRHREAIDWVIRTFSKTPVEKIDIGSLYLLRMGLFQILHMDRIPAFAAIHSMVEIAKSKFGRKTAGFINAVLRNAAENPDTVVLPDERKDPARYIGVTCSLPLWLTRRWIRAFGLDQTKNVCAHLNTIPGITLRTNTLKTDRNSLFENFKTIATHVKLTDYAGQGICFTRPALPIHELEAFQLGHFQIQDEAAQIVVEILAPAPGEKILDACAGLGGKTGHMAQLMENKGCVVAADVEPKKLDILKTEADRLGIDIIQTHPCDLLTTTVKDFGTYFDRVLLDAPCTGLGVLTRNPDTRWKRTRNDIQRLGAKQKKMLNAAANLVKPGGILVYAVCSCEREENEEVAATFLAKRKDFTMDSNFQSSKFSKFISREGFFKTYPHSAAMDGFFAARFKRKLKE